MKPMSSRVKVEPMCAQHWLFPPSPRFLFFSLSTILGNIIKDSLSPITLLDIDICLSGPEAVERAFKPSPKIT